MKTRKTSLIVVGLVILLFVSTWAFWSHWARLVPTDPVVAVETSWSHVPTMVVADGDWRLRRDELMAIIDSIPAGTSLAAVLSKLPPSSNVASYLWAYSGMESEDRKQIQYWAVDSAFGIAAAFDRSGGDKWIDAGRPEETRHLYQDKLLWMILLSLSEPSRVAAPHRTQSMPFFLNELSPYQGEMKSVDEGKADRGSKL
jgi:hypothetical protein